MSELLFMTNLYWYRHGGLMRPIARPTRGEVTEVIGETR